MNASVEIAIAHSLGINSTISFLAEQFGREL
jgi:hypothetical protein